MRFLLIQRLAWRYVTGRSSSTVSTMVGVCFASIFIGAFSLALITAIMRGFEYETHKKLQGMYPSLIVKAPDGTTLAYEKLIPFLEKKMAGTVTHLSPYLLRQALIHPGTSEEPTQLATIKGIDPTTESLVTNIAPMVTPTTALAALTEQNVILGKDLANALGVDVGNQVVLLCNEHDEEYNFKEASLRSVPVTITGVIATGISDYDERLVLAPLTLCQTIWGHDCVTYVGLQLAHPSLETQALTFLNSFKEFESYSWKAFYPSLVSALKLEKYVMFILLLLITLVASMNIVSLLFMYITYKRTDIALFKMLGMSSYEIMTLFLLVSLFIAAAAACTGITCAFLVGLFLQRYPFIQLPDAYYVSHLPVTLELSLFVLVFVAVMLLSVFASTVPLRLIRRLNVTDTLRSE